VVLLLTLLLAACSGGAQTPTSGTQSADSTAAADRPLSTAAAESPQSTPAAESVQSAVAEASTQSAATESTQSAAGAGSSQTLSKPGSYTETPFLAERVKAGKLPPIEQRLPKEPFVVGPNVLIQDEYSKWENGQQGGDLNVAATFPSGLVLIGYGATILRSPSQTTAASRPNVVSEFSHSDDYKTFHFKIRDGLKWSDGTPVTTADVRFTFEDIYQNPDLQRPYPTELRTQGNPQLDPAKLNVIDDRTFDLTFSQPYGFFVAPLNSWIPGYDFIFKPAHYLKQFHKKYAKEADLQALLKKNNETEWATLFNKKDVSHWGVGENQALGLPTLNSWVLTEAGETRRVFERNPYFWHVDSAGHQLPYADRVVVSVVTDHAAQTNALLAGQVNIASAEDISLSEMPLYVQNAEKAKIRAFTTGSFNWPILLFLNHDFQYEDPNSTWQKLVTDPEQRFGKALAAAINPDDINKSVYFELFGKPVMYAGAYNPDQANQLLDQIGMKRGSNNVRQGPDGKDFTLRITHNNAQADFPPVLDLLKQQLNKVGIRVDIETVAASLFDERKEANQIMASILWNDGPAWGYGISEDYLPNHKGPWSPMTWQYFTSGGKKGRKPPAYLEEFYKLHTERKKYPPESPEGQKVFQQMMQWIENHYVMIPTAGAKVSANVVGVNLRNVPNENAPFNLDTYINAEGTWIAKQ
jgi:peptide/nickel transport system substrate-binding protein